MHTIHLKRAAVLIWGLFLLTVQPNTAGSQENKATPAIPARAAADYIHSVIEAGRTIYSEVIVERMGVTIDLQASEHWEQENTLLLPAQFLLLSSHTSNAREVGMTYRLMSLWPINPKNGPKTQFEKTGLEEVIRNPDKPYTKIVTTRGKPFFKAMYADKAVTKACVNCHNTHPTSSKKDFQLGDVMGGISIVMPLDPAAGKQLEEKDLLIPAEVVAHYIHSVLDSDRKVYSEYIVNRLQQKNIVFASENWWEDNSLLLPAQFLLNASDLILNKNLDLDFKLISSWPINKHNAPANEFERKGLQYVARHPTRPFIEYRNVGGKTYFQAVYPDFAVTPACVSCHNNHAKSPKKDFKLNDVMGGIVMTFPVQ